jgi:hypothetical protein
MDMFYCILILILKLILLFWSNYVCIWFVICVCSPKIGLCIIKWSSCPCLRSSWAPCCWVVWVCVHCTPPFLVDRVYHICYQANKQRFTFCLYSSKIRQILVKQNNENYYLTMVFSCWTIFRPPAYFTINIKQMILNFPKH